MPSIITPNSIALYNETTGDIWYVSRKTGEITPNRDIFYTGTSCLSLNCLHYAKHYDEIPADLRAKWVERIIRWGDNHLFVMEDHGSFGLIGFLCWIAVAFPKLWFVRKVLGVFCSHGWGYGLANFLPPQWIPFLKWK